MADHLEDEEVVERIRSWWRENGVSLVGSLLLVVGGWLGWNWYDSSVEQRVAASFDQFSLYVELRQAGEADTDEAAEILALLDDEYEGSAGHLLSLLYRSGDAVEADEMQAAAGYLEQVVESASDGQMKELARMRLARVYLEQDRLEEAQALLNLPGGVGFLSMRNELQGDIQTRLGDLTSARASYQAAVEAEEASGAADLWPFLSMKLYGISLEGGREAASNSVDQVPEEPQDSDLVGAAIAPLLEVEESSDSGQETDQDEDDTT